LLDSALQALVNTDKTVVVSVPLIAKNNLVDIPEYKNQISQNNKRKIPTTPLGQLIIVVAEESGVTSEVKVTGEIYFNSDGDLNK